MAEKKTTKKTAKKKTKKKVAKTEEPKPETEQVLNVKFNSEMLREIGLLEEYFGIADEATVIFRGLALLKETAKRKELGYDLCYVERKTGKLVSVDFGAPKDAGGS